MTDTRCHNPAIKTARSLCATLSCQCARLLHNFLRGDFFRGWHLRLKARSACVCVPWLGDMSIIRQPRSKPLNQAVHLAARALHPSLFSRCLSGGKRATNTCACFCPQLYCKLIKPTQTLVTHDLRRTASLLDSYLKTRCFFGRDGETRPPTMRARAQITHPINGAAQNSPTGEDLRSVLTSPWKFTLQPWLGDDGSRNAPRTEDTETLEWTTNCSGGGTESGSHERREFCGHVGGSRARVSPCAQRQTPVSFWKHATSENAVPLRWARRQTCPLSN